MTIEVRQLLIRSSVEPDAEAQADGGHGGDARESDEEQHRQLRDELLAECKAWMLALLAEERGR